MKKIPLLSPEGWRETPGWFQRHHRQCAALEPPSRDSLRKLTLRARRQRKSSCRPVGSAEVPTSPI